MQVRQEASERKKKVREVQQKFIQVPFKAMIIDARSKGSAFLHNGFELKWLQVSF